MGTCLWPMSTSCYAVFLELSVPSNKRTSDFECCPVYVGTFEASNPGELASLLTFTVLKGSEYEHGLDCVTATCLSTPLLTMGMIQKCEDSCRIKYELLKPTTR